MDKIHLRKIKYGDKKYFAKWWRNKELIRLTSGVLKRISDQEVDKYFKTMIESKKDEHFMIVKNSSIIGHISLSKRKNDWYEIQIVIGDKKYRGKGYGSKAINLLVKKAKTTGITKIYLEVRPDNVVAIKAYEKCGFQKKRTINRPQNKYQPETIRMELI